uniref:Uncharacterized protein n=1 Tax=Anguilla anguilla TaxID=7936 RepID=A0A0E9QHX0_ANGAN
MHVFIYVNVYIKTEACTKSLN